MDEKVVENIQPPAEFPFPFPPYDIQKDFMTALFSTLNEGQFYILRYVYIFSRTPSIVISKVDAFAKL
jgi:hypothetical protein